MSYQFKEDGKRLSNWGRWGAEDERGTLNFVTPETVRAAASLIKTGERFELSIPLGSTGPQEGGLNRVNPIHLMSVLPGEFPTPDALIISDDFLSMPLQAATQLDGLAHVGYDGAFYNGVPGEAVTALGGATRNGIDKTLPGFAGRAVLLDLAELDGGPWLEAGRHITPAELDAAEERAGARLGSGDALLVRTGWGQKALVDGWSGWLSQGEPGLAPECADWIHERELALVASDNWGIEAQPAKDGLLPLHGLLIRDLGMMLGEIWNLEELAQSCRKDGVWEFFLVAQALRVVGGAGSPLSPMAIR